MSFIITHSTD